jgi:hypothetical protein
MVGVEALAVRAEKLRLYGVPVEKRLVAFFEGLTVQLTLSTNPVYPGRFSGVQPTGSHLFPTLV